MSKEFKVIESNIQPNHKEAEIWATPASNNGTKQLKYWNQKTQSWEGEGSGGNGSKPAYIGFEMYQPSQFGEGTSFRYSKETSTGDTWEDLLFNDTYPAYGHNFSSDENNNVTYDGNILYNDMNEAGFNTSFSNPVKTTDIVESKLYYLEGGAGGV